MNESFDTTTTKATIRSITPPASQAAASALQSLVLRSMFLRPVFVEASPWLEHLPFAFWLMEAIRPRVLVEVGLDTGVSFFAFCHAVDRLGLDTRCHGIAEVAEAGGVEDKSAFALVASHNDSHYGAFSRLERAHLGVAAARFAPRSIDLLHLNGSLHSMEDFEAWLPKLSDRAVVLVHGTQTREAESDIPELFMSLKQRFAHVEFVHGDGLGLVVVGAQRPALVDELVNAQASDSVRQGLHDMFTRLGQACAENHAASEQRARADQLSGEVASQRKQLDEIKQSLDKSKADLSTRSKDLTESRSRLQTQAEQHAVERGQLSERVNLLQEIRVELKQELMRLQAQVDSAQAQLIQGKEEIRALAVTAAESKGQAAVAQQNLDAKGAELARSQETLAQLHVKYQEALNAQHAAQERTRQLQSVTEASEQQSGIYLQQLGQLKERGEQLQALLDDARLSLEKAQAKEADALAALVAANQCGEEHRGRLETLQLAMDQALAREAEIADQMERLKVDLRRREEEGQRNEAELARVRLQLAEAGKAAEAARREQESAVQQALHERDQANARIAAAGRRSEELHAQLQQLLLAAEQSSVREAEMADQMERVKVDLRRREEEGQRNEAELARVRLQLAEAGKAAEAARREQESAVQHERDQANARIAAAGRRSEELHAQLQQLLLAAEQSSVREAEMADQMERLKADLQRRDDERRHSEEHLLRVSATLAQAETAVEVVKIEHEQLRAQMDRQIAEHQETLVSLAATECRNGEQQQQYEQLARALEGAMPREAQVREELARLKVALRDRDDGNRLAQEERCRAETLTRERDEVVSALAVAQESLAKAMARATRAESEMASVCARLADCESSLERMREERVKQEAERETDRRAAEEAMAQLKRLHTEHDALKARSAAEATQRSAETQALRASKAQAEASVQTRFTEIARLTGMIASLEESLAEARNESAVQADRLRLLEQELSLQRENLAEARRAAGALKQTLSWKLTAPIRAAGRTFGKSSSENRYRRESKMVIDSGLFDPQWYVDRYPDVKAAGMDPVMHYLRFGAAEKRDPGPGFSAGAYVAANPDVAASKGNPLLHYLKHGRREGRAAARVSD